MMKNSAGIPIVEFETKAKKTRESIIIKLLHKQENVAEELFDRIGIRVVTEKKVDTLRVIRFMQKNYIIMANNIKPSRSQNSLFDLEEFKKGYNSVVKEALKTNMPEEGFAKQLEEIAVKSAESPQSFCDKQAYQRSVSSNSFYL